MGCAGSKPEDQEAVLLCRARCDNLHDAIRLRYELADAHETYVHSLRGFGDTLHRFLVLAASGASTTGGQQHPPPGSPLLPIPAAHRKGDKLPVPPPPVSVVVPPAPSVAAAGPPPPSAAAPEPVVHGRVSGHADSGGHLNFPSDEDDLLSGDDDAHFMHSDRSSPLHDDDDAFHHHLEEDDDDRFHPTGMPNFTTYTTTTTHSNYARAAPPPSSVTYEQRPYGGFPPDASSYQVGGFGPPNPSASPYPYYYADRYASQGQTNNYGGPAAADPYAAAQSQANYGGPSGAGAPSGYAYPYSYSNYQYPSSSYSGGGQEGGYYYGGGGPAPVPDREPPESRPPPPPPSPPRASPWDFINPFEAAGYENYYPNYPSSRSSRDLREEEGIPDLEDDVEHEVGVDREVYPDARPPPAAPSPAAAAAAAASSSSAAAAANASTSKAVKGGEGGSGRKSGGENVQMRPNQTAEREVCQVPQQHPNEPPIRTVTRAVPDTAAQIRSEFEKASESALEMCKMLEVGKVQYHHSKYQAMPSKVRRVISPAVSVSSWSTATTSRSSDQSDTASSSLPEFEEEKAMKAGNLSSTLQKLYIWERKLLDEVKAEEDIRLLLERKSKKLKHLDDKGAEDSKIEPVRKTVKQLSTKIKIAIQVVEKIARRISNLRDEELWPQIYELIQGLFKIWQIIAGCHRNQCQAIMETRGLNAMTFTGKLSDDHTEAIIQLAVELLKWVEAFWKWTDTQRCFVKSLNDWLRKYLPDEREETDDGFAPFSPGRLGAPPVFVICNYWLQALDVISEAEVIKSMRSFTQTVLQIWQEHYRQRMLISRDVNGNQRGLEALNQKLNREVAAMNKRNPQIPVFLSHPNTANTGEIIHASESPDAANLHSSLQQVFEAMERFTDGSMKTYEGLYSRCEEERLRKETARIS